MKILYLINKRSLTSIPLMWADYINNFTNNRVKILTLKEMWRRLFSIKKKNDIVHGHHAKSMFLFLIFNKIIGAKTVYTIHGSYLFLSKINKKMTNFIFKHTDYVVFVNKYLFDVVPNKQKMILKNKKSIILNGVDYDYEYKKIDVYKKYGLSKCDPMFFHPARFVREKNHFTVIQAMKGVVQNHPNLRLILAGDGVLKPAIEREIEENDLKDNIKLIGTITREEVFNFLDDCDLFLMPSISEGLNVSFLEAFSKKANILVSNIEQFVFPLKHYQIDIAQNNIILIDPNDVRSIEQGLTKALTLKKLKTPPDPSFSINNMVEHYLKIYKSISDR